MPHDTNRSRPRFVWCFKGSPCRTIRTEAGFEQQAVRDRRAPRELAVLDQRSAEVARRLRRRRRRQSSEADGTDDFVRVLLHATRVATARERGAIARDLKVLV